MTKEELLEHLGDESADHHLALREYVNNMDVEEAHPTAAELVAWLNDAEITAAYKSPER